MIQFKDLSIRRKLIVLLGASAAIALSISAIMSLSLTFITQRNESLRHLHQIADIASDNLTAALVFRDNVSAARMLGSLRANPQILTALIHDESEHAFAAYQSPTANAPAVQAHLQQISGYRGELGGRDGIDIDFMYVIAPMRFEGKVIGSLTLLSDNSDLKHKLAYYVLMQTLISVATLLIIGLISVRLQRVFTAPIFYIIDVIRKIAETKNYAVSVDTLQNDEFKGLYSHFNDMIAEIHARDAQLSRLATTDPLTGLSNRRHAMETMQAMVTRALRKQEFFGLISFDVDHFKRINDQFGHPVGDLVLKEVARLLAQSAREIDLVARIGGEEFVVLCDNSDVQGTRLIAERIRLAVENAVIGYDHDKTLNVTVSAGVFAAMPVADDIDIQLSRVDEALYRAKESGRNKVCIWEPT